MAVAQKITKTNFSTLLKESTNPRSGGTQTLTISANTTTSTSVPVNALLYVVANSAALTRVSGTGPTTITLSASGGGAVGATTLTSATAISVVSGATYTVAIGAPDGNVYFDTVNDRIQLIGVDEIAQVNFGSGLEANPLTNHFGITLQALYAFERRRRRLNTSLRRFLPGVDGVFQFGGAWLFTSGIKLDGSDRAKIRESGWIEYSATNLIDRIYFGVRSLNEIQATSQPYIQLASSLAEADLLAATPINASRVGPLDEAFQVYGSTANGDSGAGNFDFTIARILAAKVRTFGFTQGEATSTGSGVSTLQGFSAGFGLGESISPTNSFSLANVYTSAIAPFTGMTFTRRATPLSVSGFVQAAGNFTDVISNTGAGSLAQVRARMDAWMTLDIDINDNTAITGIFRPKRASALYTIDDQGRLVTRQGLFLQNIAIADQQSVVFTDDAGNLKTYPFNVQITVSVSDAWRNDANGWYAAYFKDGAGTLDFDTVSAVIVNDASGNPVTGTSANATGSVGAYRIVFNFDYDGNTQAGLAAGINKTIVLLAEGDGGAQAALVEIPITRQATITAQALSEVETNL